MLCKKCGFGLSSHANFCPKCGEKGDEKEKALHSKKSSGKWLEVILGCIILGLATAFLIFLFSDRMTDTVSDQLEAIKENEITKAYYSYTSKSFQDATPLTTFHEFMDEYPIFTYHTAVRFIDRNSSTDKGFLHAMIMSEDGDEIPVEYQLVKENDKWLINSIKLDDTDPEEEGNEDQSDKEQTFDSTPLKQSITKMMGEIKKENLKDAYENYTSEDFQKTTSFDDFQNFIKENASFSKNQSIDFDDLSFDNNMATITGKLKDDSGKMYAAEYNLVEENGTWKIFHVRVWNFDPNQQHKPSELMFSQFVVGSSVDDENVVTDPKTVFASKLEDIYLNLYVEHVIAGTKIDVIFEHTDTHSKIPTVSKRILESGDVIVAFVFTPPKAGWPDGNYRITAISSTGETKDYDFKVNTERLKDEFKN